MAHEYAFAMGILRYLFRRLLFAVVLVLGVSAIIFFLLNAIGNPIDVMMADNPGITDEALAAVKAYYHLDANVGSRYLFWLGNVALLDFGTSISTNMPVGGMLLTWGAETLKLQIPAILLALLLSIGFATIAAMRQYSRLDFTVMSAALLGHSLPGFLLGVLLILLLPHFRRARPQSPRSQSQSRQFAVQVGRFFEKEFAEGRLTGLHLPN